MTPNSRYGVTQRLGIFWFCGERRKPSTFIGISRAWAGAALITGARRLDISHEVGWAHAQRLSPALASFEFDHFPRGRLEWQENTDQWRLYVAPEAVAWGARYNNLVKLEAAQSAACRVDRLAIP